MSDPRLIPPPPNYPPSNSPYQPTPEPRIILVTPEPAHTEEPGLLAGARPVWNLAAIGASLAPIFGGYSLTTAVGLALHDIQGGHLAGAWTIAGGAIAITLYIDQTRKGWFARVLLATAVLGTALSLPVLDAVLILMTGVHR